MKTDGFLALSGLILAAFFLFTAWLSLAPADFNIGSALLINSILWRLPEAFVSMALSLTTPELQAAIVVALMCGSWFSRPDEKSRARLMGMVAGSVLAAFLAHAFQHSFPSVQKPLFLPGFAIPDRLGALLGPFDPAVMSGHSFPSERGVLFAGLAMATAATDRRVGVAALAVTFFVDAIRVLLGMHFVMDIVGSFCLAMAAICFCSLQPAIKIWLPVLRFEMRAPAAFYAIAFLGCYELLTTFDGLRQCLGLLRQIVAP